MNKGISIFTLLFLATCAQAATDTPLIKNEAASVTTLAGSIGETAMFAVQADEDEDLELFATASSKIDSQNDHWLLFDWDGTDYQIIKSGNLQAEEFSYVSSYQVSVSKLLLGHEGGKLTTIEFSDDINSLKHLISETHTLLSELTHEVAAGTDLDTEIKAIVKLEGTDQVSYTVLCTSDLIHILNSESLQSSLQQGGYCQTGNIDYQELAQAPGTYDQELITQNGGYFTFDGENWIEKDTLTAGIFGDRFLVVNIDDDDADEILSQQPSGQLQSFSPTSYGSWVYFSTIQTAIQYFNAIDIKGDGVVDILFDYIDTGEEPNLPKIKKVSWDASLDSHVLEQTSTSPYLNVSSIKRLPTRLTAGVESDFFLFASNASIANPTSDILYRLNEDDLTTNWSGIYSTSARSFEGITRTQDDDDSISGYKLVQLEQIDLGNDNYEYAYKFLNATDLLFKSIVLPDFTDDEIISINSFSVFDFDQDGIDELHAGGKAGYAASQGIVISSNLNGSNHNTLNTPSIESVTALYIGDVNLVAGPDIIATGKNTGTDGGIGIHFYSDDMDTNIKWFKPGNGDTDFKRLIASNIKGDDKPEILGLHSQLASYNPNAGINESSFYNLTNIDLKQFTPVTLENRDYQYALASDAAGMLLLVEPKDFDVLTSIEACNSELAAISSTTISNNVTIALAICGQQLKSWIIEYDIDNFQHGYSFRKLPIIELGNTDTSLSELITLDTQETTGQETHLFALFKNTLKRFELNRELAEDSDNDNYLNYQDAFPENGDQWVDADKDGLGDNPAPATNPDPSPNDIDNDGVSDATDPDNNPVNDLNPLNDIDHGLPYFNNTSLDPVKAQYTSARTPVDLAVPTAQDLYDTFMGNGIPTISARVNGTGLSVLNAVTFQANLVPGKHNVAWKAQDIEGNYVTTTQEVWVYPNIAFNTAAQRIGEAQTGKVKVVLSGVSPEYPVSVIISVTGGELTNDDITQDISQNLTVVFEEGKTEAFLELDFISDQIEESDESIQLTILDTFNSTSDDPSWTVDDEKKVTTFTVVDLNTAPVIADQLSIEQDNVTVPTPNNIDGIVTLSVNITDLNLSDTHIHVWNLATLGLGDILLPTVSFDATKLEPGVYAISLTVTDNGLPNLTTIKNFSLAIDYGDTDKDGVNDNVDAFPNDSSETLDSDGDGVGDNLDAFPFDPLETVDSDGDKVGNVADVFPNNVLEYKDTDSDGVGDNADVFPTNASETVDTDDDGVGDNSDVFPHDADETADSDGDGIGDVADAFPRNMAETTDTDGDGVGDNSDFFPGDASRSSKPADQSLEDNGSGPLGYWLTLLLLALTLHRNKKS